jgi:hypothetical protein
MKNIFIPLTSTEEFNTLCSEEDALLFYFSHDACNVCKVLKPKLAEMLNEHFPKIKSFYADTKNYPDIAGQNSIFAVPTILVWFGGREYLRKSRNISLDELAQEIERPYEMMFSDQ